MSPATLDLKEQLKERLFASISAQIDCIAYVPADLAKLAGDYEFDAGNPVPSADDASIGDGSMDDTEPEKSQDKDRLTTKINNHYDEMFYATDGIAGLVLGKTEYRNIGYWDGSTKTQDEASVRLQDALLDLIPEKSGRILDAACGMGASTRRLLNHYAPDNVWAINISEKQIKSTIENAPGCHAEVMNAVDLTFEDDFFDNILCIEAAFHFQTRRRFLEQAHRVLKPGGRVVLSDVLFTSADRLEQYDVFPGPENHLETADAYRDLLSEIGFRNILIDDFRKEIWVAHFLYVVNLAHEAFSKGALNIVQLTDILWTYNHLNAITGPCLFVSAQK